MEDRPREQDELAFASHQSAAKPWQDGFFTDLVFTIRELSRDNNVRADTSLEKLSHAEDRVRPQRRRHAHRGNSSPLTDGAACVLLASEDWAASSKSSCPRRY
jgi:acetyl-CoA C-acetyltransferase